MNIEEFSEKYPQHAEYAGGDLEFGIWLVRTDRVMRRVTHGALSLFDLADCLLRDKYESGSEPRDAAMEALEEDELGSMVLQEFYV